MARGLVIVDIQKDYFPGGAHPLEGPEAAAESAARLLAGFRASGDPVFHVRHVWGEDEATFMRPGTEGAEIHESVAPLMTSMCVDATVRAAVDLGFETTVVHDACATRELAFDGTAIPAASVHAAFLAALADGYAAVVSTDDIAG